MPRRARRHSFLSRFAILLATTCAIAAAPAHAQVRSADPSRVEFTLSPGGMIGFREEQPERGFANYRLGGAVTVNLAKLIAFEADAGASFGFPRPLDFRTDSHGHSPNTLDYNANLLVNLRADSRVVPYLTAGAGAITVFKRERLGIDDDENYFTGNAGGGVKWLRNGRWGVRADYRFLAMRSKSNAPAVFGRTGHYGHRVYAAAIVTLDNAR